MAKFLDLTGLTHFWSKVKAYVDGAVSAAKTTVGNYTINGQKISSNPTILGNVTNDAQVKRSEMGKPSGVATLDEQGKIDVSQIPGWVDDIVPFQDFITTDITVFTDSITDAEKIVYSTQKNTFVAVKSSKYYNNWNENEDNNIAPPDSYGVFSTNGRTPVSGKLYVVVQTGITNQNNGKEYKWNGSSLTELPKSLVLGETSSTAFRGDYGKIAYNHAQAKGVALSTEKLYKITTNSEGHVTKGTAVTKNDITALGIPAQDTTYGIATASKPGLVKPASVITKPTINTATTTSGKYYHVQMSSDGAMFVNVPWTDNNTTYGSISDSEIDGIFS